jgi:O-antigen/teichoic acid export membrane protein
MVALNIVLVPRWGILGAALALSASIVGTNLWALVEVRKRLELFPYNRGFAKVGLAAIVTTLALVLQRSFFSHETWRAAGVALPLAYIVFLGTMLTVGFDTEDRVLARMAWSKIRGAGDGGSDEYYA